MQAMSNEIATDEAIYLRPLAAPAGAGRQFELISLAGGEEARRIVSGDEARRLAKGPEGRRIAELLANIESPPGALCGLGLDRPRVMGVLNVTPDSFSDGGKYRDPEEAIDAAFAMQAAGADIIDVGGSSSRPGSSAPDAAEETARVLPVIAALAKAGMIVSIDTRSAEVMRAALDAGARIINDISALAGDPASLEVAARSGAPVVLMHMQGTPETMQRAPSYGHVAPEIFDYLEARIAVCEAAGIPRARLIVDPGIGFGKTMAHNLQVLRDLALFRGLGCPLLVGLSRKQFIARLSAGEAAEARMPGSLAGALHAMSQGAHILRVHDVGETVQAIKVWRAIEGEFSVADSN
jgi:dihydropteroate synthase